MKTPCLILFFIVASTGTFFSQVAKEDFKKINEAYATHPDLSVSIRYEAFKNKNTALALSTEKGEIKHKGADKYTQLGKIESVETEHYTLIVDHDEKNISLLGVKTNEAEKKENDALYPVNLEKLIALCSKVEFKKVSAAQNSYMLVIPGGEYEEIKLMYNAKTFFIEKLVLYYSEKQNLDDQENGPEEAPRLEITYSDYNISPDFGKTPFSYDAFLEKQNGKLVAKPAYKGYTVNEQLFKK